MMKYTFSLLAILISLTLWGCGRKAAQDGENFSSQATRNLEHLPNELQKNATALLFDHEGNLMDFVHISRDSNIETVLFEAPDDGNDIYVVCVGENVSPEISENLAISSKKGEFYMGQVSIDVEKGSIVSVNGNGMATKNFLSEDVLKLLTHQLADKSYKHKAFTSIYQADIYRSQCIEDEEGNLVPSQMSKQEKAFVETMVAAFKSKKIEPLLPLIHMRQGDKINTLKPFIEQMMKEQIGSYEFYAYDKNYHDEKEVVYSLDPKWFMSLQFEGAFGMYADFVIGEKDSKMWLLTKYAK